jgi:hypothetical protein
VGVIVFVLVGGIEERGLMLRQEPQLNVGWMDVHLYYYCSEYAMHFWRNFLNVYLLLF